MARSQARGKSLADASLQAHVLDRNQVRDLIARSSATPVAARPGYLLGEPNSPTQLRALGIKVENGITALDLDVVAATSSTLQRRVALMAVEAARREASWSGASIALPGDPTLG